MQALFAIARLTFKAAFRFRLVPLLAAILIGGVLLLPAVIKDDGTARGLTQIVLTYTLGLTTTVLGLTTLWLACGTLARDIEECHMQVVATKPVARWQIWLGKWLGIMMLNAALLTLAAGIVYGQLLWRAKKLPPNQQEILRNEVFIARGSFHEAPFPIEPELEHRLQERLKDPQAAALNRADLRRAIREQIQAQLQVVPPGFTRRWRIDLSSVRDQVRGRYLFLRAKFYSAQRSASGTFATDWEVGPLDSPKRLRLVLSLAPDTFHEIAVPPDLLDSQGVLDIQCTNANDIALLFPLEEGMEVLYREGGFGPNYARGVAILFCWLALLAALGLTAASFLSFPVAAFCALSMLVLAFSTGTMRQVVEQGTVGAINHDTGRVSNPNLFDHASVAVFQALLTTVNLVRDFSPIDALSSGRNIPWTTLARAFGQIVVLMGGIFAAIGITIFTRRELATAQGTT
jgi:hypothetical protein